MNKKFKLVISGPKMKNLVIFITGNLQDLKLIILLFFFKA